MVSGTFFLQVNTYVSWNTAFSGRCVTTSLSVRAPVDFKIVEDRISKHFICGKDHLECVGLKHTNSNHMLTWITSITHVEIMINTNHKQRVVDSTGERHVFPGYCNNVFRKEGFRTNNSLANVPSYTFTHLYT